MSKTRKTKKQTNVQPQAQPRPTVNGLELVFGLIFTLGGLFFFVTMAQVRILSCTRLEPSQQACVLQNSLLGLVPLKSAPLEELQGAKVEESMVTTTNKDSQGHSRTDNQTVHTVILLTQAGEVALDPSNTSFTTAREQTAPARTTRTRGPAARDTTSPTHSRSPSSTPKTM